MELELKKGILQACVPIVSKTLTAEESSDAVVADSKPDILRIADTRCLAEITSREVRGGKIFVSGVARCFVVYGPEGGGGPECVPVTLPFSVACDPGEEIPRGAYVRAGIACATAVAREQNPRRVNVRVTVRVNICIWSMSECTWCEGVGNGDTYGVELLCEDMRTVGTVGMGEKLLSISESAELGEVNVTEAELLFWNLAPRVTEVKLIPGKAVFKGEIGVRALLKTPHDSVAATHLTLTVPFSGVTDCENADTDAEGRLTARCFDSELCISEETGTGRGMLTLKTNLAVEAEVSRVSSFTAITDAYSTTHDMKISLTPMKICPEYACREVRADVKEVLNAGIGVRSVYCAEGELEEIGLAEGELYAIVRAILVFEGEDGGVYSVSKSVRAAAPATELGEGKISRAEVCNIGYRISGAEEIEFSAGVEAVAAVGREEIKNILVSASLAPRERRGRTPSLTLCGMLEGESWWELGKRMRASVAEILAANNLAEGDSPGDKMLLIPQNAPGRKLGGGENI